MRILTITLALGLVLLAAKEPLELDGTSWSFPTTTWKAKAKAQKIGKAKDISFPAITLDLLADTGWSAMVDGKMVLGGSYVPNVANSRLKLELDETSKDALEDEEEARLETVLSLFGLDGAVDLNIEDARIRVAVKNKLKKGEATARLKAKLKYLGTTSIANGVSNAPSTVRNKVKGTSQAQPSL